ncbi:hypothetical protein SUGI_0324600 [Cryptomeria japonica]|uniref:VQ motif-containing protein 4 n=1 Tax=Cryptomeria japonica TaxID=3369 RepID=UPI002408E8FC|nr:VQ motif-containing protein 4 [Cryptomeria japonica]GLJ18337.1 hypothetical protein SUGI_0324600 [Cryptomeria japonica]
MTKSQAIPATPKQWGSVNSECRGLFKQSSPAHTFVEIDSHSFKELVQKLTGFSEDYEGQKLPVTMAARSSNKGCTVAATKSDGDCFAVVKNGIEMGPQKSALNLHIRRHFKRKLEIKLDRTDSRSTIRLAGDTEMSSPMTLPALVSSPITPLGIAEPFTSSSYYQCSSTPTSCNQSSYLEEEFTKASPNSLKRIPELLPLFPLHSSTEPNV